jgi:tripartite-type tricarboxylate transporter receptor subunit TctC
MTGRIMVHRIFWAMILAAGLCLVGAAPAQYPARPIKLVVLIAPGGGPDVAARVMAPFLSEGLGQPIVVENKVGSNGNIAGEYVARSAPDGYTLLFGADSLVAINPHIYSKMSFDTLTDLAPVATTVITQLILSVNPQVPVRNFREFLDYARAANLPLNYASGGNGSQHHLSVEMLKLRAGIRLRHIPYRSGSPAAAAAVAGEVPIVMSGTSSGPLVKSGRLRAVAVTGRNRLPLFPDVPTIGEFYPGYEVNNWLGIWAPAGTPDSVIARLRTEINRVLALPEVRERFGAVGGSEPWITTPEEFAAVIRRDYDKYGKLVKDIGAKID